MDVDPLASMRRWAITLDLGGREFEIPALAVLAVFYLALKASDPFN